jgi:hypothetical protein
MKIFRSFVAFAFISLALSPRAHSVSPPPDGGYPNGNTAEGEDALFSLTTGVANTAVGVLSLALNGAGDINTAVGAAALLHNTTGGNNTAIGAAALLNNTNGGGHTAVGYNALATATAGANAFAANTAVGVNALFGDTTGNGNTAVGAVALFGNTTGGGNTAIGNFAGATLTTGHNNIIVGAEAGSTLTTGDNNIDIFDSGVAGESNTIRIGTQGTQTATYIAGVYLTVLPITVPVAISPEGQLGEPSVSSARFKDDIKPMDKASEAIFGLKPITFHYKKEIDPKGIAQFGLVAEEVEKVNSDLVVRDKEGKPYTVRYDQVNAMLLNEFLKEHKAVQELESNAAKQEATIARQQKQIEALTAGLQKVSAQLEVSKAAPQTVLNNR